MLLCAVLLPALAGAQNLPTASTPDTGAVTGFIASIGNILNTLLPIFITLAVLVFFWGLVKFIFQAGDDREKGRNIMIWGLIGLFVIVSVWGIVSFLGNLFGIGQGGTAPVPGVGGAPTQGGGGGSSQAPPPPPPPIP